MIVTKSVYPCLCGKGWQGAVMKGDKCFDLDTFGSKEEVNQACMRLKAEFIKLEKKIMQANLKPLHYRNTSGVTGVMWNKRKSKWISEIAVKGKTKYIGEFKNKISAVRARRQEELKYGLQGISTAQIYLDEN